MLSPREIETVVAELEAQMRRWLTDEGFEAVSSHVPGAGAGRLRALRYSGLSEPAHSEISRGGPPIGHHALRD
ncbi:MAG: hypothetical protein AB1665_01010 [Candidatus Thermoplasmatota archaeon]